MVSVQRASLLALLCGLPACPALAQPAVIPGIGPAVTAQPAPARTGRYGGGFIEFLIDGTSRAGAQAGTTPHGPSAAAYRASAPSAQQMRDPDYGYVPEEPAPEPVYAPQQSYAPQSYAPRGDAPQAYAPQGYAPQGYGPAGNQAAAPGDVRPVPGYAAPRKAVDPIFVRQDVPYAGPQTPGTVVIDTANKFLYLVQPGGHALRYGIGVGRPGFVWSGEKTITRKAEWPGWTPPAEMVKRRPDLPSHMDGGLSNPLGARAMYLGDSLYRIHGTNEPDTIGTNVSSGCIRLTNDDVADLYERVRVGTRVVVM